jgi:hypothetical protein
VVPCPYVDLPRGWLERPYLAAAPRPLPSPATSPPKQAADRLRGRLGWRWGALLSFWWCGSTGCRGPAGVASSEPRGARQGGLAGSDATGQWLGQAQGGGDSDGLLFLLPLCNSLSSSHGGFGREGLGCSGAWDDGSDALVVGSSAPRPGGGAGGVGHAGGDCAGLPGFSVFVAGSRVHWAGDFVRRLYTRTRQRATVVVCARAGDVFGTW